MPKRTPEQLVKSPGFNEKLTARIERIQKRSEEKQTRYTAFLAEVEKEYPPRSEGWLCACLEYMVRYAKRDVDRRESIKLLGERMALWKQKLQVEQLRDPAAIEGEFQKQLAGVFDKLEKRRAGLSGGN